MDDATEINTTAQSQTVNNFGVDDCSSFTNVLFNFTLKDETSQNFLDGNIFNTSIKVDLIFSDTTTETSVVNFSQSFQEINSARICSESVLGNSKFRTDAVVEYKALNKFLEYYNIQNFTFGPFAFIVSPYCHHDEPGKILEMMRKA